MNLQQALSYVEDAKTPREWLRYAGKEYLLETDVRKFAKAARIVAEELRRLQHEGQ